MGGIVMCFICIRSIHLETFGFFRFCYIIMLKSQILNAILEKHWIMKIKQYWLLEQTCN